MKAWFDWIMDRRARQLTDRLRIWIPAGCRIADIGSGTGHNARTWRTELGITVDEFDVADLHWVGAGPLIFDGHKLPVANAEYSVVIMLFVLQYTPHALDLLREVRRISADRVVIIQSTYRGKWGRVWLNVRAFIWGPVAFLVARFAGILQSTSCPLISQNVFSRQELRHLFQQAGLTVRHWEPQAWWGLMISRDLFVLDVNPIPAICPSSSPHAMKNAG